MRYLWIEDFDGGKNGQTQTQHDLETYFQLENKITKLCSTLEETLAFLDIPENWRCFDAVLIDIRFKIGEKEGDEKKIYEKYFSSFLIYKKYEHYTKRVDDDANTASAGVLLYLALVHRYNYNQDRIAFISANVDETSDELYNLTEMREYVEKAKCDGLEDKDIEAFELLDEDVLEQFEEIFGEEAEKKCDILKEIDLHHYNLEDLKELEKRINKAEKDLKEQIQNNKENKNADNLKYNSVKQEFEGVGLKVARAFEKPTGNSHLDRSWKFQSWVDELNKEEYYRLRSTILPVCLEIDNCKDENLKNEDVLGEETTLLEIKDWIQNIMVLFPEKKWAEDNSSIYSKVVKECVKFGDRIKNPDANAYKAVLKAYKAVLKITRNWTAHLEISGLTFFAVVFIFHISVNAYLNVEAHEKLKVLEQNLIGEFCKSDLVENREGLLDQLKEKYREIHKSSCEEFYNKASKEDSDNAKKKGYRFEESASFYQTISGIGNKYSPKKNEVSMAMIYALFIVMLGKDIVKNGDKFINEVFVECSE